MAEVLRYVNTASTAGGDGTTNATAGANRAYASLSEWEAAEQTDLVTDGDTHRVECSGASADTTSVFVNGWTTGASNGITVNGNNTSGKLDTANYRLSITNSYCIYVAEDDTTWNQMQFVSSGGTGTSQGLIRISGTVTANPTTFTDNVLSGDWSGTGTTHRGFWIQDNPDLYIINNMIYLANDSASSSSVGIDVTISSCDTWIYNNTVVGYINGIVGVAVTRAKNNIVEAVTTAYSGSWHADSDYNLSSDATDPGGANDINSTTLTYVDAANDDYHLTSGDVSTAVGVDLSADADYSFSTDIDGDTRSNWSMGADDGPAAAAGGGAIPPTGSLSLLGVGL